MLGSQVKKLFSRKLSEIQRSEKKIKNWLNKIGKWHKNQYNDYDYDYDYIRVILVYKSIIKNNIYIIYKFVI